MRSCTPIDHQDSPPPRLPSNSLPQTRQLLDIVTNSLYTDKDVFLRELVSNASDALEKLRHLQSVNSDLLVSKADDGLKIKIDVDEEAKTLTITDTGVGMTASELSANLGTIAKSGSREFMADAKEDMTDIIGKFGVGFYSAFMIGDRVTVVSRSAKLASDAPAASWESDGGGEFTIGSVEPADLPEDFKRGTRITIHLKETEQPFGTVSKLDSILKKYSNFVSFPIELDGERVNTMEAVWAKEPKEVDDVSLALPAFQSLSSAAPPSAFPPFCFFSRFFLAGLSL